MNALAVERCRLIERARAAQAALSPHALARFDAWAQALGGAIHEFTTLECIECAIDRAEDVELDRLIKLAVLHAIGCARGEMSASKALNEFREISRDRALRAVSRIPGLRGLFRSLDFIVMVTIYTMIFVLVSEGACDIAFKLFQR